MKYSNIREEELKNKIAQDYFWIYDWTKIVGNVDFCVCMHQSQKDKPPFPGSDDREFWQRAEQRNRETARLYRSLGLAEYEAMVAFRRWKF